MKSKALAAAVILLLQASVQAAGGKPSRVVMEASERVRAVLSGKVKKGTPAEEKRKQELKQVVDGFLDYRKLGELSLGPHWKERTPQEQAEFVQLLRDLIESAYTSPIEDNIQFTLKIEEEQLSEDGKEALVVTVASAKNSKGREVAEDLTFHLYLQGKKWMVFDVEFGDISMVRHYRSEFNKKIKKESYAALIAAMKKKLEEIRAGKVKVGDKPPEL